MWENFIADGGTKNNRGGKYIYIFIGIFVFFIFYFITILYYTLPEKFGNFRDVGIYDKRVKYLKFL